MKNYISITIAFYFTICFSISIAQVKKLKSGEVNALKNIQLNSYPLEDSSKVRVWIENGWVNAERMDKNNDLIWRLIVFKFDGKNYPLINTDGAKIKISNRDDTYFISTTVSPFEFFPYEILRGIQEDCLEDINAKFDPSIYGVTTADTISISEKKRLLGFEKDGWRYIAIGSSIYDKTVGLVRMQNNLLEIGGGAASTEGFNSIGNNHFFWDRDTKLIYAEQTPSAYISKYAAAFKLLTNKDAPKLNATNWFNKPIFKDLDELKGKVVILYFWATWCGWCLPPMQKLETLGAKYADKGLVVIGVHHYKNNEKKIIRFLDENENIKFPICTVTKETIENYYTENIPKYYIIGRDGKVIRSLLNSLPKEEEIVVLLK